MHAQQVGCRPSPLSTDTKCVQVDPHHQRTVMVASKLDTKIVQWAAAEDVGCYLKPGRDALDSSKLVGGGPFFTSVPLQECAHTWSSGVSHLQCPHVSTRVVQASVMTVWVASLCVAALPPLRCSTSL